jgi:hypothetical protein
MEGSVTQGIVVLPRVDCWGSDKSVLDENNNQKLYQIAAPIEEGATFVL